MLIFNEFNYKLKLLLLSFLSSCVSLFGYHEEILYLCTKQFQFFFFPGINFDSSSIIYTTDITELTTYHFIILFVIAFCICISIVCYFSYTFFILQYEYYKRFFLFFIILNYFCCTNFIINFLNTILVKNTFYIFKIINSIDNFLLLQIRYELKLLSFFYLILYIYMFIAFLLALIFSLLWLYVSIYTFFIYMVQYKKIFLFLFFFFYSIFVYDPFLVFLLAIFFILLLELFHYYYFVFLIINQKIQL